MENAAKNQSQIVLLNDAEKHQPWPDTLKSAAKGLVALILPAAIFFHLIGHVAHETYCSKWRLNCALFPKQPFWVQVHGYLSIVEALFDGSTSLMKGTRALLGYAFFVGLIVLYVLVLRTLNRVQKRAVKKKPIIKLPLWSIEVLGGVGVTAVIVTLTPLVMGVMAIALGFPTWIGAYAGEAIMKNELKAFSQGCAQKGTEYRCSNFKLKSGETYRGFMFEGSENHIAIFDVQSKSVRTLEIAGLEVETPVLFESKAK